MRQAYHITKGADRSRRRRRAGFGVLKVGIGTGLIITFLRKRRPTAGKRKIASAKAATR
jgi:hypothetical protein